MRCGFTRTYTLSITRHTSIGSVLRRLFLQFCLSSDVESRTRSSTDYCTAAAASTDPDPAAAAPAPAHKGPDEYGKARFSSPCLSFSFPACCRIFMSLVFSFSLLLHHSCLSSSLPAYRCRGSDHPRLFLRPYTTSTSSPRSPSRGATVACLPLVFQIFTATSRLARL